jgi:hypothetical protein
MSLQKEKRSTARNEPAPRLFRFTAPTTTLNPGRTATVVAVQLIVEFNAHSRQCGQDGAATEFSGAIAAIRRL